MKAAVETVASGALLGVGAVLQTGVETFGRPLCVPIWFVLAGWILPTGDVLAAIRTRIPGVKPNGERKGE